ncbi:MAG: hypothetical protein P8N43_04470 [Alphaproteobacteria bacterium]|nr:hypothetical protein [Alphaproteobacteria bacterium]
MTTTTHGNTRSTTGTGTLQGIWLPLITPFLDGALDEASLGRLVRTTPASRLTV